jgi:hypothetical protein
MPSSSAQITDVVNQLVTALLIQKADLGKDKTQNTVFNWPFSEPK